MPVSDRLKKAVLRLYEDLETTAGLHDELTDTDVREALAETLNFYFVCGRADQRGVPCTYEMFSAAGDKAVAVVVNRFLEEASECLKLAPLDVGQPRHDVLRDASIRTSGGSGHELFIGGLDAPMPVEPLWEGRFEPGEYDDD